MKRYNRPVYSDKTYREWAEAGERARKFAEKHTHHTHETIKVFAVNGGYYIKCIQRKYDECMKKENEYGVQVFVENPDTCPIERIVDSCCDNKWFNNAKEANEYFKSAKEMCY